MPSLIIDGVPAFLVNVNDKNANDFSAVRLMKDNEFCSTDEIVKILSESGRLIYSTISGNTEITFVNLAERIICCSKLGDNQVDDVGFCLASLEIIDRLNDCCRTLFQDTKEKELSDWEKELGDCFGGYFKFIEFNTENEKYQFELSEPNDLAIISRLVLGCKPFNEQPQIRSLQEELSNYRC